MKGHLFLCYKASSKISSKGWSVVFKWLFNTGKDLMQDIKFVFSLLFESKHFDSCTMLASLTGDDRPLVKCFISYYYLDQNKTWIWNK